MLLKYICVLLDSREWIFPRCGHVWVDRGQWWN